MRTTDGRPYEDIDATLICRGGSEAAVLTSLPQRVAKRREVIRKQLSVVFPERDRARRRERWQAKPDG